jgi:hypothetical protein
MAPNLTEEEIDDLVYFARVGEDADLTETLTALSEREKASPAEILLAAKDEGKSTTLHMAAGNGHLGKTFRTCFLRVFSISYKLASVELEKYDEENREANEMLRNCSQTHSIL